MYFRHHRCATGADEHSNYEKLQILTKRGVSISRQPEGQKDWCKKAASKEQHPDCHLSCTREPSLPQRGPPRQFLLRRPAPLRMQRELLQRDSVPACRNLSLFRCRKSPRYWLEVGLTRDGVPDTEASCVQAQLGLCIGRSAGKDAMLRELMVTKYIGCWRRIRHQFCRCLGGSKSGEICRPDLLIER